jgi:hypothetical protein
VRSVVASAFCILDRYTSERFGRLRSMHGEGACGVSTGSRQAMFSVFHTAVLQIYPGSDDDRRYSTKDLQQFIHNQQKQTITMQMELGQYHQDFLHICKGTSIRFLTSPILSHSPPVYMYSPSSPLYYLQGSYSRLMTSRPDCPTTFQKSTHR